MDELLSDRFIDVGPTHWWFAGRRRVVAAELERLLPPGGGHAVLDAGCGSGSMIPVLEPHGAVTALDEYERSIDAVRARYPAVDARVGAIPDGLPTNPTYDVVAMFDVLEHLDEDTEAVRAAVRALRPGGLFVCTVPAFMSLWGRQDVVSQHRRRYRSAQLGAVLAAAGLDVRRLTYFNTLLFPLVAAARLGRRLTGRAGAAGSSDFDAQLPAPVNRALGAAFAAERHVLRHVRLPFGVSLFAAGQVPTNG